MNKLKMLLAAALLTGSAQTVSAQQELKDYEPYPYNFISVQGGGQATFTSFDATKLITPVYAVSLGRFFSPVVGTRLHVSGFQNKGGLRALDRTYEYKYVTSDLDLMLNLSNIVCPKRTHAFNAILVGGVGLSYAWDSDDFAELRRKGYTAEPMAWDDDRLVHNFRVGMLFEVNLGKHVGVNLELAANNLHDRFNQKQNGHGDWQATAMAGLTFKFGHRKRRTVEVNSATGFDEAAGNANTDGAVATGPVVKEEVVVEEKPVVKPAPATIRTEVFFPINVSEVQPGELSKVARLAEWLKAHPKATVEVTGYADKGTGNADINYRLSKERMEAVVKMLTGKYGIDASRFSGKIKGDTEQPFSENDKNRVVISEGTDKE